MREIKTWQLVVLIVIAVVAVAYSGWATWKLNQDDNTIASKKSGGRDDSNIKEILQSLT